ncbi:hypothetical protein KGF56_003200 [Candida oxycetoniae]|uniref:Phosphatidylinositol N-acetylglucosaminyltransferase subunit H conserved domain-containing protein n=1 Tax=Candida oxycetoniae TaxID=497107 RepID=A0AAI9SWJ6_9ASCO|nr:uncharacterized protein KGF56_003200 [Candida oxycetoniae]KAI3404041.1 hypothetical protein KGF56_003200 [Candida oxycetoniae]
MSSSKNYILEIDPPIAERGSDAIKELDLLKFTVKLSRPSVLLRLRVPLLFIVIVSLCAYTWRNWGYFLDDGTVQGIIGAHVAALAIVYLIQEQEDSLIVMRGIGAQLSVRRTWFFQNSNTFIPIDKMIDFVIHEGFHNYAQVIFYLCILTKDNTVKEMTGEEGDNNIKVVFEEFLPRKEILLQVWKLSRQLLFGETRRYWRRKPSQGLKQLH